MVLYVPLWSHMVPYGPLWSSMGPLWFSMVPYGPLWSHMVFYGPLWSSIVPYGPVWYPMAPYGSLWSPMVLNCALWSLSQGGCHPPYVEPLKVHQIIQKWTKVQHNSTWHTHQTSSWILCWDSFSFGPHYKFLSSEWSIPPISGK